MAILRGLFSGFINNRGYVITLDAAFALLLLGLAIGIMGYFALDHETELAGVRNAGVLMDDAVALMDEKNLLRTVDEDIISGEFEKVLPEHHKWRVKIEQYSYSSDTGAFTLENTVDFNSGVIGNLSEAHGRRFFLTYNGGDVERFNNMEYWVQLGG